MSSRLLISAVLIGALAGAVSPALAANATAAGSTLSFASSSTIAANPDTSPDTLAGTHPYTLTSSYQLHTATNAKGEVVAEGGPLKELILELPPGLIVNPRAVTRCGSQEFTEGKCPDASAVGTAQFQYTTAGSPKTPITSKVPLYDLTPPPTSPALFGIQMAGAPVYLTPTIRTSADYDLTVALTGLPEAGINVLGGEVTLWGAPAQPEHDSERGKCVETPGSCPAGIASKPLVTLPTQCSTPPVATMRASSWQEPETFTATASDPLLNTLSALGECGLLDFSPTLEAQVESAAADSPSGLTLHVHMPQSEEPTGRAEADLQEAVVALPPGMALNLARAGGLVGCPEEGPEGVNLTSAAPSSCPAASRIGAVKIETPLLDSELTGSVYLAQQGNLAGAGANPFGSLLALYVVAEGAGVVLKLPVEVAVSPETGQLSLRLGPGGAGASFAPQLPLEEVTFEFDGGSTAVLATPPACGNHAIGSQLTPWSGTPAVTPSAEFTISEQCATAFGPALSAGTANQDAGAYSPLSVTLTRQDDEQEFKAISITLPEGMLAMAGSVPLCGEPQASLGTCPQQSLIGEERISIGVGPTPLVITGTKVYFTGPYGGGPFGLSFVVPAVAGPLNLGAGGRPFVIRTAIRVNRRTGQVTIATDPGGSFAIPTLLQGIPPQYRTIAVSVTRPEFTFNPSGCAPLAVTGEATSTAGTLAHLTTPFQATNCSALPFGPKLSAAVVGRPSRANGIGLDTKIVEGYTHESNAHYVKVELPRQLPARIATLRNACQAAVFEANPAGCPSGSVVGTAEAVTSVLPVPLTGPAYMVSYGSAKFPELVMVLQGYGVTVEVHGETFIDKSGIISATFPNVPDAPIPSFELHLPQGPGSILSANGKLCGEEMRMATTIVAYNGLTVKESPQISVPGCKPAKPALEILRYRVHGRVLRIEVRVPSAGTLLAGGRGVARGRVKVARAGTATIKLRLARQPRSRGRHRRKARRLVVRLAFIPTHGSRLSARVKVRVR